MLCGVITGPSLDEIQNQINQASLYADILEIRWDCFDSTEFEISCKLPMIFTLRPISQGGYYLKSEEMRMKDLARLLEKKPNYVDLEYTIPFKVIEELKKNFPEVKTILSYHNFDNTPDNLNEVLFSLKKKTADLYKIATMANTTIDALRMLNFTKLAGLQVIGLCMGECGIITRILNHFTYACLEEKYTSKLSQLSLNTLINCYRYKTLNSETDIYGLIGNPVDKSPSNIEGLLSTKNVLSKYSCDIFLKFLSAFVFRFCTRIPHFFLAFTRGIIWTTILFFFPEYCTTT